MKVKEESEKVGLKLNIQRTKIMASGPITSWEIDEETVETVSDFILGRTCLLYLRNEQKKRECAAEMSSSQITGHCCPR